MAGDWIKIRTELINDLDVMDICEATTLDEYEVVGRLVKLWGWANHNTTDGYLRKMTPARLDKFVHHAGFASALLDAAWLVESKDGMTIPNWQKHNGSGAKVRAEAAARQAASRSRHKAVTGMSQDFVTPVTVLSQDSVTREDLEQNKTETKTKTKPKTGAATPLVLPAVLDTAEFRSAWDDYEANRKEAGHSKLTTRGREIKLKELADWGHDVAVQSIRESIANGWQGIFKPKGNVNDQHRNGNRGYAASDATERRAAKAAREFPEPDLELPVFVFGGDKRADDSQRPTAPAPRSQAGGA
jgi:hypothetical protein